MGKTQERIERIAESIYQTRKFKVDKTSSVRLKREKYNWFELQGVSFLLSSDYERDEFLREFQAILGMNDEGIIFVKIDRTLVDFEKYIIPTMDVRYYVGVPSDSVYSFGASPIPNPLKKRPKVRKVGFGKVYLEDNTIAKVLVAYRFAEILPEGFLYSVFPLASEIFFVWNKEPVSSAVTIIDRAKKRKLEAESTKDTRELERLEELGSRIMSGTDLISFYLIFVVKAETETELRDKCKELMATLKRYGVEVQELPVYVREVYTLDDFVFKFFGLKKKFTDTESAKAFFTFISEEVYDPDGIFLGVSGTGHPVVFDVYSKPNYLTVILGVSGSGKSTTAKIYLKRMLEKHDLTVIGIDPESEYVKAHKAIGINAIDLKEGQKLGLDPIKLMLTDSQEQILTVGQIVDFLSDIYMIPTQLQGQLKNELFTKVERKSTTDNIVDFVESLEDRKLKQYLAGVTSPPDLYIYEGKPPRVTGSVVFGMKDIKSNTTKILISALLSAYVYNRLLTKAKKSIFFVDEAWLFMGAKSLLTLFDNIAKRGRKYGCNFLYVTQRVEDIAKTSAGRSILEQASTTMIFKHERESINTLIDVFKLNTAELNMVINAGIGVCLFKTGGKKIKLRVIPTQEELEAFSTTPVN